MKRSIFGTVVNALAAVAALIGLIAYINNTNTTYFSGLGKNTAAICAIVVAIAALVLWIVIGDTQKSWKDILPIIAPALIIYGFMMILNARVNGIAAIMTFENNASNMADLTSAITALAALAIAALLSCIASFTSVKKDK